MLNDSDPDNNERAVNRLDLGISSLIEGNVEVKEVDVPIGDDRAKPTVSGPNLGIGELLGQEQAYRPSSPPLGADSPPSLVDGPEQPSEERWKCFAPPPARTESSNQKLSAVDAITEPEVVEPSFRYEELVQAGRWEDICRDCEKRLAEAGGARAIEPRLWWIFSQLRLDALPVSILHSRFAKASESLASAQRCSNILHLASTVGLELADALEEEGQVTEAQSLRKSAAVWSQSAIEAESSKSGVSGSRLVREPAPPAPLVSDSADPVCAAAVSPRRKLDGRRKRSTRRLAALVPAILSIVVGVAVLISLNYSRIRTLIGPAPYVSLGVEGIRSPEPIPPVSEPLKRFSDLTAIYYDVSAQGPSPSATSQPGKQSTEATAPASERPRRRGAKERVDTSSPKETREIRRMARERREEKVPDIDFPPFVKGAREERNSEPDARAKPTFSRSRVATVAERTSVYSLPAKTGKVIERLEPGDRVLAVKRHGRWLEIESSDGAGGYVPVEDIAGY